MTPEIRKLFLKICGNTPNLHSVAQRMYYLDLHFPPEKLESALNWLVRNNLTELRFVHWFDSDCAGSNLEMHRNLTMRVERDSYTRQLFASKDLKHT
jgi:hypothetical protein